MPQKSAGILLFRRTTIFELLLVHPGGPFWAKRWKGAWQIAKGMVGDGETEEQAARREFEEETGIRIDGPLVALGSIRQKGGKEVVAFAAEGDCDPEALRSNSFEIEWPLRSGRRRSFPEVDAMRWFDVEQARASILAAQAPFVDRLLAIH
jgi:predicted NUDIX family NTP pyrophosphohydrolase